MKMSLMQKVGTVVREQLNTLHNVGIILNRPLDTGALADLATTLDTESRKVLERVVSSDTNRVRALRDIARLVPALAHEIDTKLAFSSLLDEPPAYQGRLEPDLLKIYKMELLRVLLMTSPEVTDKCLDMDALVKQNRFQFCVSDWNRLMISLDELNYIELHGEISVTSGQMTIGRFVCRSEDVDYKFAMHDHNMRVRFDTDAIFNEFFQPLFDQYYPTYDLDLGSFKKAFDEAPNSEVSDNRRFVIYTGQKNNIGQYYEEHYTVWAYEEKRTLFRIEAPGSSYPQRQNVSEYALIPWMVALMSLKLPDETHFLVQYDPEEQNVVVVPGDPYAEPDSLAEVLPEGGN